MKLISLIAGVVLLGSATLPAQSGEKLGEAKFWVRGNCPACEKRIETTLKKIDGVKEADWDQESGDVTVTFDAAKTDEDALEQAVATAGHATKRYDAVKENHDKLPGCCQEGYGKHID